MNLHLFRDEPEPKQLRVGSILIATPMVCDSHFKHSVVLIVTHEAEGSMGIILNKEFPERVFLNHLLPELTQVEPIPISAGGPMDMNTLFFIHKLEFLVGSLPLGNGLYLSGDFPTLVDYIRNGNPVSGNVRFFAGYAGWDKGQLKKEIADNAWFVGEADESLILEESHENLWQKSMQSTGIPYPFWMSYPIHPIKN